MLRRLYDRLITAAAGPNATATMIFVSFAESSLSPLPPTVLLVPMMVARPKDAWGLAACATLASVTGGLVGYAIGYFGFDLIGRPILEFYGTMSRYDALKAGFDQWGVWIIILKGFTPIPYKLVAIASGVAHFDIWNFVGASAVQRSSRFFLMAALFWWFGSTMRDFIERRLVLVTCASVLFLVCGFLIVRYL